MDDAKFGSANFTAGPDLILGNGGHETEVRVYKKMETSIVSRAWAEAKFPGDQIISRSPVSDCSGGGASIMAIGASLSEIYRMARPPISERT